MPLCRFSVGADRAQPLLVAISCVGWVCNHFTGLKFAGQADISAAVGAFAVGIVANLYARFCKGNAFVIMVRPPLPLPHVAAAR